LKLNYTKEKTATELLANTGLYMNINTESLFSCLSNNPFPSSVIYKKISIKLFDMEVLKYMNGINFDLACHDISRILTVGTFDIYIDEIGFNVSNNITVVIRPEDDERNSLRKFLKIGNIPSKIIPQFSFNLLADFGHDPPVKYTFSKFKLNKISVSISLSSQFEVLDDDFKPDSPRFSTSSQKSDKRPKNLMASISARMSFSSLAKKPPDRSDIT
jgi:hypothetical protein